MNYEHEVHQIKTFHFQWCNYCYIVVDKSTQSALIIDPAWELLKISEKLSELKVDLKAIFLTHSHDDHVNLVDPLVNKFNPIVYMSKKEIEYYEYKCRNLRALNNNEKVSLGNTEVLSLLTPGHTAGSMCYLLPDSLFTGDTIFVEGCGVCNEPGGSADELFASIQRIKSEIHPYVRVYPGHSYGKNPGQTIEYLFKENLYFQIEKKEHFVNFRMRKNQKNHLDFK